MASSVWRGVRFGRKLYSSSLCFTQTTRITFNTVKKLWKYRISSAIYTVSQKRLYASEKRPVLDDPFSVMKQGLEDVAATHLADSAGSKSNESQGEDDPVMQDLSAKYQRYKLWLARIMGKDPETFSDKDIKEAIEYLMPSGLYAKDARPIFEDPKKLYQKQADLLDKTSRPLHAAFFTGQIGFHDLLFEIYEQSARLDADEEPEGREVSGMTRDGGYMPFHLDSRKSLEIGSNPDLDSSSESDTESSSEGESSSDLESSSHSDQDSRKDLNSAFVPGLDMDVSSGKSRTDSVDGQDTKEIPSKKSATQPKMRWIGKLELERKIRERLTDKEYDVIIHRLKKLASHPNAERATPFLLQFLHVIPIEGMRAVERTLNDKGESVAVGHRKRAIAEVVVKKGTGNVTINNTPLTKYFSKLEDRKQIMYPFLTVDAVGEYDVDCGVIGGGTSGLYVCTCRGIPAPAGCYGASMLLLPSVSQT
ncbi:small ribosomal subunit protein uS9m-like isoform X2 [Montipora capricornis]|uniref:small ribosomal subunit protein uS9m-like isoform X2 n=1 Tax=Montipora capricornis TaxID=246305 RepID=UPI0035F20DB7